MAIQKVNTDIKKWDLEDEERLLSAILECGFGNWIAIAKKLTGFSPEECEYHYMKRFIEEPDSPELWKLSKYFELFRNGSQLCSNECNIKVAKGVTNNQLSVSEIITLENELQGRANHLSRVDSRPYRGKNRTYINYTYPGYNPERSEFDVEYDDKAESVLSMLQPYNREIDIELYSEEERILLESLEAAIVEGYNFRLSERMRRKKIIRSHALLDRRKTFSMMQRYEGTFTRQTVNILMRFLQFFPCGAHLDFLLESLKYQTELKLKINELLSYRREGIRLSASIEIYNTLLEKRSRTKKDLEAGAFLPVYFDPTRHPRKSAAPLTLHNLPGYSLLDDDEKDLCSVARIVPETYHGFKTLLVAECNKHDGLKLAQARSLVKIDVNKTRKIYDFLISRGFIWQPN